MVIITLVGWYILYLPVRRVVAYKYRRFAAAATCVAAMCFEFWLTQDFFHELSIKFF